MIEDFNDGKMEDLTEGAPDQFCLRIRDERAPLKYRGGEKPQICIEFTDLTYAVSLGKGKRKEILKCISGHFRPNRLTVIIGPSGAGKTTLLSIISGLRTANLEGSITINGFERNAEVFRKQASYIPQEFTLLPLLTAKETLYIAALLKLGWPHTSDSREFIVTEIADRLGLMDCFDTMVENLSGGERKRLSIGVELITDPPVMLLDEPTSGLDSAASNQVVGLLHAMAQTRRTIVCAVHQPSSRLIAQFDDVIILDRGRIFFCGPMEEMIDTFKDAGYVCPQFYNIAEFVLEVVTEQRGGNLERLHEIGKSKYTALNASENRCVDAERKKDAIASMPLTNNEYPVEDEDGIPKPGRYPVSRWKQLRVLLSRAITCAARDNTMTKLRLAAHVVVAILLGILYYDFGNNADKVQSNIACLFFILLFLFFANAMPTVQIFPTEATVFLREHMNNWYSLDSYYVSKVVSDLPLQIVCPTCFIIITYWMTGQPFEGVRICQVWLVCILLTILAQSFGIVTGTAFGTQAGVFLVPALNIPMFLFAGFFLKIDEVPAYLQPMCFVSFFRYAFAGILQAIYSGNRNNLECFNNLCHFQKPEHILEYANISLTSFYPVIIALTAWIFCLHVSIYAVLRWKLYRATR